MARTITIPTIVPGGRDVTINIPDIDRTLVPQIEKMASLTYRNEVEAIDGLRRFYSTAAAQGGHIKTLTFDEPGGSGEECHTTSGARTRAFIVVDQYREVRTKAGGLFLGRRLHLAGGGHWIETERCGRWENAAAHGKARSLRAWTCIEKGVPPSLGIDFTTPHGIRELTSEEVAAAYSLERILEGLAESVAKLAAKLRDEYAASAQRAQLAVEVEHALRDRQDAD